MIRFVAALIALLIAGAAAAQNVTVIGPVTPGNVPVFNSTTVIKDSGTAPGSGGTVAWINVKSAACGAVGNGIVDDTAAINTCIGQFNAAGNGTLYFPAGTYKTTAALTAITANGVVRGDGMTNLSGQIGGAALPGTLIQSTSSSASLFTVNSQALLFSDLALQNTSGTTPTAGSAGITVTSSALYQKVDYQNIEVAFFFIDIDIQVGALWSMHNANIFDPVLYGVKVRNTVNPDAGDWSITNSSFFTVNRQPTSALRIESAGGGKIVNMKMNSGSGAGSWFTNGIDVVGGAGTIDLFVANSSFENFNGAAIKVVGSWPNITMVGLEIGSFATGATNAILLSNTSNVTVSNILLSSGFTGTPISLSNCTNCYVSGIIGSTTPFSAGTKPDHDGTGGIATFYFADGTVSSESRLNWTVPVGQFGELRLLQDATTTNRATAFIAKNDAGNGVVLQAIGTTNSQTSLQNKGVNSADNGLVLLSDQGVASGGSDDVSIRAGGWDTAAQTLLVQHNGHVAVGSTSTPPTLTAGCNGAGSVVSGNDANGTITGQTAAATTCTLSFGTAYSAAPNCAITGLSSPLTGAITVGTGSIQVNFASTANYKWSYICHGA